MRDFIICYDIRSPRRLGKVYRKLKCWAVPIQYSVFLYTGDRRTLMRHLETLVEIIVPTEDDLRCYPLPGRGLRQRLGPPTLPEGLIYTAMPNEQSFLLY